MEDLSHHVSWNEEGMPAKYEIPHYRKQLRHSHRHPAGNQLNPYCPSPLPQVFPRNKAHKSPGLSVALSTIPDQRTLFYPANTCIRDT